MNPLETSPLGKPTTYLERYDPGLLCPIARDEGRALIGLTPGAALPFHGEDIWNAYEVSWLDMSGKPEVATMRLRVPVDAPHLIESKSLKLYLSGFNMARHPSADAVAGIVARDLADAIGAAVAVALILPDELDGLVLRDPPGGCLDRMTPRLVGYTVDAGGLSTEAETVSETWFSRLFRSTCPVTGQPDWGTVFIDYTGPRIDPGSLLGYLVSYRQHAGFHENCVERIFMDLSRRCGPTSLTVAARFTRRGGLDINPVRSSGTVPLDMARDPRQ